MSESSATADRKAIEAWFKPLLDKVVKEMIDLKIVEGLTVQATPVWMLPHELLLAKVWAVGKESEFVWTMSVDKLISDYVGGSIAATPQQVARHFSLKWQLDADRLLNLKKNDPSVKISDSDMQEYASRLIHYAETLHELSVRDEAWDQLDAYSD